jgi:ribonuclease HII
MANNTGKKFGGRTKGTPNKKTIDALNRAESILQLIESEYLVDDIKKLTSSQRSALYKDLLQYRAPMLTRIDQRIQANVNLSDEPVTFE